MWDEMTYITVGDDRLLRLRQVPKEKEMSKKKKPETSEKYLRAGECTQRRGLLKSCMD